MGSKRKAGVSDYFAFIFCLVLPMTGIVVFVVGAMIGSWWILIIGLGLIFIPLLLAWIAVNIRDALRGNKDEA